MQRVLLVAACLVIPTVVTGSSIVVDPDTHLLITAGLLFMGLQVIAFQKGSEVDTFVFTVIGTLFWMVLAICLGCPIPQSLSKTALWSIAMSALTCSFVASQYISRDERINALERLVFRERPRKPDEAVIWGGFYGCLVGSWMGALCIPLDWDEPWQEWPIPVLYGGLVGFALGGKLAEHTR